MNKKWFVGLLAALLLISLVGCGDTSEDVSIPSVAEDELVELTIASIYAADSVEHFDGEAYAASNGFESAALNDTDDTVTIVMTGKRYNQLLTETMEAIRESYAQLPQYEGYEYIQEITFNSDLRELTMKVDQATYDTEDEFVPEYLASAASFYRALLRKGPTVNLTVVDASSGETIAVMILPQE